MSLSSFQESAKAAALALTEQAPEKARDLQAAYSSHFPAQPLSAVAAKYTASNATAIGKNDELTATISTTVNAIDSSLTDLAAIEAYINLTIPKMEDGNNFGVTVQLAALKQISDVQEKLGKNLEELLKYESARADVVEKCKHLTSKSVSKVTSSSESESVGTGPNKETKEMETSNTSDKKSSTETKQTESSTTESPDMVLRQQAVTSLDVLYYSKAKAALQNVLTGYITSMDFVTKNEEKISKPKGSQGGRSYHSMY